MKRTPLARRTPLSRKGRIKAKPPRRLSRPGSDPAYLRWIRTLPCVVGAMGQECPGRIEASHIRNGTGIGIKPPDRETLPKCSHHHAQWEQRRGVFSGWTQLERWAWAVPRMAAHVARYEAEHGKAAA